MKKRFLGGLGLLATLCACAPTTQPNIYQVEGELNDSSSNGKMIYITRYDDDARIDSALVEGNKFIFKGEVDTAAFCRIEVSRREFGNLILESGAIKVNLKDYNSPSGTPMNEEMAVIAAKEDSIYSAVDKKREELRAQYSDDKEYRAQMEAYSESLSKELFSMSVELFKAHSNDAVGEFLLRTPFMPNEAEELEAILADLGPWLKSRKTVQKMVVRLVGMKNTAEGKPFVDIKGKDADGKEVTLSDYVGKGNYVLMDMWASWCGPCKGEIPNLAKLQKQFGNKGFTVLGVFVWDKEENLRKSMKEEKMTWPQIFDSEGTATDLYGVDGIPQIILFAPDGTIAHRNLRGENMIQTVTELMNKK